MKTTNTKATIDAYDKNAEKYAEKFDNYLIYQDKIKDFHKKFIPLKANILDLGCGPGNNIQTILDLDNTCRFTGLDLSKRFLDIARSRFPQFRFLHRDIRSIELASAYDVVIASFCIVHLTDEETDAFLRNVSKLMVKNGHLYLSYMNGETSGFASTSFSREEIFFNYYSDQFVIDLLGRFSFQVLELGKEEYIEPDGSTTTDTFIYARKVI